MLNLRPDAADEQLTGATTKSIQVDMWLGAPVWQTAMSGPKLLGTQAEFGSADTAKMPLSGELTAQEQSAIEAWIAGGAAP